LAGFTASVSGNSAARLRSRNPPLSCCWERECWDWA
jgi:hypothetical protein